jgi:hypothetical protein
MVGIGVYILKVQLKGFCPTCHTAALVAAHHFFSFSPNENQFPESSTNRAS